MEKLIWKGIFPAITTKFTQDGKIDYEAFFKHLNYQIESGIHGVILAGTLGEASSLTRDEKVALLQKTLEYVKSRIPVLLNIAESSTKDAVWLAEQARQSGAQGLMLLPPMLYQADKRETLNFHRSIVRSTDLPVIIYNNPVDYGIEITPAMIEQLLKYDNVQAIKESTRDISNVTRLRNAFGDRLKILCGVDTLALESLVMGADGWVAGLVNAFPRETVAIYDLVKEGKIEQAKAIYRWFMPVLELDIDKKLVQYIKMAEALEGVGTEYVREPRLRLEGDERLRIEEIVKSAIDARPVIHEYKI